MNPEYVSIFNTVLALLVSSGVALTIGKFVNAYLQAKLGPERFQTLNAISWNATHAVEQVAARAGWTDPEKMAQAISRAEQIAGEHGLTLPPEQWATLIEASVKLMKQTEQGLANGASVQSPVVVTGDAPTVNTAPPPPPFDPADPSVVSQVLKALLDHSATSAPETAAPATVVVESAPLGGVPVN